MTCQFGAALANVGTTKMGALAEGATGTGSSSPCAARTSFLLVVLEALGFGEHDDANLSPYALKDEAPRDTWTTTQATTPAGWREPTC